MQAVKWNKVSYQQMRGFSDRLPSPKDFDKVLRFYRPDQRASKNCSPELSDRGERVIVAEASKGEFDIVMFSRSWNAPFLAASNVQNTHCQLLPAPNSVEAQASDAGQ